MKKLILGVSCLIVALSLSLSYKANHKTMSNILLANIQALTNSEKGETPKEGEGEAEKEDKNPEKLTVCLCAQRSPTNGYYQFSEMKNHCHTGIGNSCAGKVSSCSYTWYCNL